MNKRIYSIHIQINNKKGYPIYVNNFYAYNLDKAIELGKQEFIEYYNNHKPKFSKISFDDYMNKLNYSFFIDIISGERKQFKSYDTLNVYFNNTLPYIDNDQLYDFLLSLIDFMYTAYNYKGELIDLDGHFNYIDDLTAYNIKFTEEGCKNRDYIFEIYG